METLHSTRASDITPLKSDGAKTFWQSFSVVNLPVLELVADSVEGTRSNQDGKMCFDGVPLKPPSVLKRRLYPGRWFSMFHTLQSRHEIRPAC